jgi:glucokinase
VAFLDEARNVNVGDPAGMGVVVPGVLDEGAGIVHQAPNLGWAEVPLRHLIEAASGLPVVLGHDSRAGGLAEVRFGAAKGVSEAFIMPVGTGISGAVVTAGRIVPGLVGEIGHLDVGSGVRCACGAVGCLETVASAAALARRYQDGCGQDPCGAEGVAAAVRARDPLAVALWSKAVDKLAQALAAYTTLLAPEVVVVGGGLGQAGELLLSPLRAQLGARLTFQRVPRVESSALGIWANAVGAAVIAQETTATSGTNRLYG